MVALLGCAVCVVRWKCVLSGHLQAKTTVHFPTGKTTKLVFILMHVHVDVMLLWSMY